MNSTAAVSNFTKCLDFELWNNGLKVLQLLIVYRVTLTTYLGLPISLIGIVTSAMSVILFSKDHLTPPTTRRLLLSMSVVDIVFPLASTLYLQPVMLCGRNCRYVGIFFSVSYLLPVSSLVNIFEMLRNWLVVLICVERFIITCYPLKARRWLSVAKVNVLVAVCAISSVLFRTPYMASIAVEKCGNAYANTLHRLRQIHSTTDAIMVTLLPLLILTVCSVQICRSIRHAELTHGRIGRKSEPLRRTRGKVTRVLLIVIVVFAILMLPLVPVNILAFNWFPEGAACRVLIARQIFSPLAVFGSLLHSAANFFIYVVYWGKYRRILMDLFKGTDRQTRGLSRTSTLHTNDVISSRSFGVPLSSKIHLKHNFPDSVC
ncbi:unnamed protein product [Mesocestoides corti]|uniref:G_PROTEIN_RECEP_F1_2 domain-containing protein n=1 Tax=Mesocestoides corti TaxID=53468 RepID=A0A0R3UCL4_MESCO|nr:unnamed protein product [Mesocestoides corti]